MLPCFALAHVYFPCSTLFLISRCRHSGCTRFNRPKKEATDALRRCLFLSLSSSVSFFPYKLLSKERACSQPNVLLLSIFRLVAEHHLIPSMTDGSCPSPSQPTLLTVVTRSVNVFFLPSDFSLAVMVRGRSRLKSLRSPIFSISSLSALKESPHLSRSNTPLVRMDERW